MSTWARGGRRTWWLVAVGGDERDEGGARVEGRGCWWRWRREAHRELGLHRDVLVAERLDLLLVLVEARAQLVHPLEQQSVLRRHLGSVLLLRAVVLLLHRLALPEGGKWR